MIQSYRDLNVWKAGMALAKQCYIVTKGFPNTELFGMTSQIRRAAASIPANIAEGNGRENTGDYVRFLRIAQGSLKELETHVLLANDVELMNGEVARPLLQMADEIGRMLRALIRALQSRQMHAETTDAS